MMKAKLIFEDGTTFNGYSFGAVVPAAGEAVFNTAMTGYPESLTDPSYKGQILVASYPLIGNYGVPDDEKSNNLKKHFESDKLHLSGFVISEYSEEYSHWNAKTSLSEWMKENNVPGIYGVDTRAITQLIRDKGSMLAKIVFEGSDIDFYDPNQLNLVDEVSIKKRETYGSGKHRILLIDCGLKNNIIRHLLERDTTVIRVPWDYDISSEDYDGLFISNGPGDPKKCEITIENLKSAFSNDEPVFGICLGSQLMALAAGGDTYKMNFGHRGHNQPVINTQTGNAYITSQNHGYAVDDKTLPPEWKPLFLNLNDNTIEGVYHGSKPFFATQFHPEASGGPTDTEFLFDEFIDKIKKSKESK
jgi:carbamoyl-phosphate synthase small subunit